MRLCVCVIVIVQAQLVTTLCSAVQNCKNFKVSVYVRAITDWQIPEIHTGHNYVLTIATN